MTLTERLRNKLLLCLLSLVLLSVGNFTQCMEVVEEPFLSQLPCEQWCEILKYLDLHSLAQVALTCKNGAIAVGEIFKKEICRLEMQYADLQKDTQKDVHEGEVVRCEIMCSGIKAWIRKAALEGQVQELRFLVCKKKIDINAFDSCGDTVLRTVVCTGNVKAVERLVALGADLDKENASGITSLMHAVLGGAGVNMVRYLIELGADVRYVQPVVCSSRGGWVSEEIAPQVKEFDGYTIFDLAQENELIDSEIRNYLLRLRQSRRRTCQCVCL